MNEKEMLAALDDSMTSRGWIGRRKEFDAIRILIVEHGPEIDKEVVKKMASKINNGIQDGMADKWIENWLWVLLEEAGVQIKESPNE